MEKQGILCSDVYRKKHVEKKLVISLWYLREMLEFYFYSPIAMISDNENKQA